jgi:hypothetical protein
MLIIFFHIKGTVYEEFILAGQAVNSHTTAKFYGDCMKMCEDFAPNFDDKRTDCCITTKHRLKPPFSPVNFWQKITVVPNPHNVSLYPLLKTKLKGRHFDTIEVTGAESQALNTLTEDDFQDAFKKCHKL